jgi:hypothetical protein
MRKGLKKKSKGIIPRKKKQLSKTTAKTKAWAWFSKYIRLRDCLRTTGTLEHGKCISCGKLVPMALFDAGHFVSRRYNSTLFDERNVSGQCRFCNRYLHGNLLEYRRQLVKMFGEGIDTELEDKATEIKKYSIEDYKEIEELYKNKYQKLLDKSRLTV